MAREARETGRRAVAEMYQARAKNYRAYATTLRKAAMTTAAQRRSEGGAA
jgi:two-component system chemotaxis response regulator CheB